MAYRSRFFCSLIIQLLIYQIVVQFVGNASIMHLRGELQTLSVSQDLSQVKINSAPFKERHNSKSQATMSAAVKTVIALKLLNITLTEILVLLANDVSQNPGPIISLPPDHVKGLRIFHINICSVRNKLDELRMFCDVNKPHVLSLNETWLDDSFSDMELNLPGYQLLRRDRDCHGGGIAVYVAENLNYSLVDTLPEFDNIEALWFELSQPNTSKILFGAVYRPPSLDASTFTGKLEEMLNYYIKDGLETIFAW